MKTRIHSNRNFIAFIVIILVILLTAGYFVLKNYTAKIENQLFDASSNSIEDTYAEAVLVFDELTTSRWKYLSQTSLYLKTINEGDEEALSTYVSQLQQLHSFTGFYLLNDSGSYITADGQTGYIDLGDALFSLVDEHENIVTDGSLPGKENMFFYAVPAETATYMDFTYCAVAFGYDKQGMKSIMDLSAYNGASDTYLVYPNGRVCITMGDVRYEIRNVLSTLKDAGVSDEVVNHIETGLSNGEKDTAIISLDGTNYYITYQTTKFSDWRIVGITPAGAVDQYVNDIRSSVTTMMVVLGAIIISLMGAMILYLSFRKLHSVNSLLAEREMIFNALSEHMDEVYILYNDETDRILYVSPNVERLIGVKMRDLYEEAAALTACVVEQDLWNDRSELKAMQPGQMRHREYHIVNKLTRETHPYIIDIYRSEDAHHPHTIVLALKDNSHEAAVREEISAAMENAKAANAAKSAFLSNMSHDIRTPMNAIIGFATLLEKNAENPEQVRNYIDKILSSSNHLLGLINDVLDISKIESGVSALHLEETRLEDVVGQIEGMIRQQSDAKQQTFLVSSEIPAGEKIMADPLRLRQILQNLLSNAIKYTPDGGKIELAVLRLEDKEAFAHYQFIVADNGIGMSEDFQEKIFQPFSRETSSTVNKIQGTGLGMSITKNLVDMMGGFIRLESAQGKGSVFTVDITFRIVEPAVDTALDVAVAHPDAKDELSKAASNDSACDSRYDSIEGLHILAAEDNALNAEILAEFLDMDGAICTMVHDGKEAVEAFEAASPGEYDLILMDVQMPVMNGYDATRAIRSSSINPEGATIPIIAMTANAFNEDIQNALDAGMNAHLTKPLDMDKLRKTIRDIPQNGGVGRKVTN